MKPSFTTWPLWLLAGIVPAGIVYYWVLLNNPFLSDPAQYAANHYVYWLLVLLALGVTGMQHLLSAQCIRLCETDLWVFLFFLAAVVSNLSGGRLAGNESMENLWMAYFFYLVCRSSIRQPQQVNYVMALLAGSLLVQWILGGVQFAGAGGFTANTALSVTGTLGNSGIWCGFSVILCPLLLFYAPRSRQKRLYNGMVILLVALLLAITRSRAACFGFLAVLLFLYGPPAWNWHRRLPVYWRRILGIAYGLLFAAGLWRAFYWKAESALGRWVIWKAALPHVADHPLLGIGYGTFSHQYPFWQAAYFQLHPPLQATEGQLVTIPSVAFNDPLQLLLETGVTGLALFVILNFRTYRMQKSRWQNEQFTPYLKALLPAWFCFSFFSYPLHSTPLLYAYLWVMALLAAASPHQVRLRLFNGRKILFIALLPAVLLPALYFAWNKHQAMHHWKQADALTGVNDPQAIGLYQQAYPHLQHQSLYLHAYGLLLYQAKAYHQSVVVLEKARQNMAGIETLLFLGKAYTQLQQYRQAEASFQLAAQILPGNFEAHYLLAKLYLLCHREAAARLLAEKIMQLPVKVPSAAIDQMRSEMHDLLIHHGPRG